MDDTSLDLSATSVALPQTIGPYEIIKRLRDEVLVTTYLAQDTRHNRRVMLQVPRIPAGDAARTEQFHSTTKLLAGLEHRNVCPVYEDGTIGDIHYAVLAEIKGQPLADFIQPGKQRPQSQVAVLLRKIAFGLSAAHAAGVVHGLLNPHSIYVDIEREPVLIDFELARQSASRGASAVAEVSRIGPEYLAPEHLDPEMGEIGPATDIYCLGVIAYQLLTGRLPFEGTAQAIRLQKLNDEVLMPSRLRANLHPSLDLLCLSMLARRPADRFSSLAEAIVLLDDYLQFGSSSSHAGGSTSEPVISGEFLRACQTFEESSQRMEVHKRSINDAIANHEFLRAQKMLFAIAAFKDPRLGEYVDWAQQKLAELRDIPQRLQQDSQAAYRLACRLYNRYEYQQAVDILKKIPVDYLSDDAAELLSEAAQIQEEINLLSLGLDVAVTADQYSGCLERVRRLLELKPDHRQALELLPKLQAMDRDAPRVSGAARRRSAAHGSSSWVFWTVLGISVPALIIGLSILVSYIKPWLTPTYATVRVEIDNPTDRRLRILIDDRPLKAEDLTEPIRLEPGQHTLVEEWDGRPRAPRQFTVTAGQQAVLQLKSAGPRK